MLMLPPDICLCGLVVLVPQAKDLAGSLVLQEQALALAEAPDSRVEYSHLTALHKDCGTVSICILYGSGGDSWRSWKGVSQRSPTHFVVYRSPKNRVCEGA